MILSIVTDHSRQKETKNEIVKLNSRSTIRPINMNLKSDWTRIRSKYFKIWQGLMEGSRINQIKRWRQRQWAYHNHNWKIGLENKEDEKLNSILLALKSSTDSYIVEEKRKTLHAN